MLDFHVWHIITVSLIGGGNPLAWTLLMQLWSSAPSSPSAHTNSITANVFGHGDRAVFEDKSDR